MLPLFLAEAIFRIYKFYAKHFPMLLSIVWESFPSEP